jgi:RNA polymerase sigma factor for flagellar operon FliA
MSASTKMLDDADLRMQWTRWLTRRNLAARDHLIVHYSPLVKFVAGRVGAGLPASVDRGDLVGSGVIGLIDAMERYDASHGVKFETFAVPRIRGAIYDSLRKLDWVPRSIRSQARSVEAAISQLEHELGRAPTDDEIAEHLQISSDELDRWLVAIASTTVGPLDRAIETGAEPAALDGPGSPSAMFEDLELGQIMRAEIRKLPEREKLVLSLYYDEGLTLAEIGQVLEVTESRVSQIHTKSVLHLRSRLTAAGVN